MGPKIWKSIGGGFEALFELVGLREAAGTPGLTASFFTGTGQITAQTILTDGDVQILGTCTGAQPGDFIIVAPTNSTLMEGLTFGAIVCNGTDNISILVQNRTANSVIINTAIDLAILAIHVE